MQPTALSKRQQEQLQELNKQKISELTAVLLENNFPIELIPKGFNFWLQKALEHEKPRTLNCEWKVLRAIHLIVIEGTDKYNMQQFGFACNCIEDKSPFELSQCSEGYISIQDTIEGLAIKWKEIADELNAPILNKYAAMEGRVRDNKPLFIPNTEIVS